MTAAMSHFTLLAWGAWCILCVVWMSGYVADRRAGVPARLTPHLGLQVAASVLLFFAFALLLLRPNLRGLAAAVTPQNALLGTLGALLAVAGVAWAIWARLMLGLNWSGLVMQVKERHELVQTGPYAIVRHPIYTGILAAVLGTALTLGKLASYLAVAAALVALLTRVEIEERMMAAEFGEAHAAYRRRTRKLIPFVW